MSFFLYNSPLFFGQIFFKIISAARRLRFYSRQGRTGVPFHRKKTVAVDSAIPFLCCSDRHVILLYFQALGIALEKLLYVNVGNQKFSFNFHLRLFSENMRKTFPPLRDCFLSSQRDVQHHHKDKAYHDSPSSEVRVRVKLCVGYQVFHNHENHGSCGESKQPRLRGCQIRGKKISQNRRNGFNRSAAYAEGKRLAPASRRLLQRKGHRRALGKILYRNAERKPERRNIRSVRAKRACRSECETDCKSFGNIVNCDRKKHLDRLVQGGLRPLVLVCSAVEMRNYFVKKHKKESAGDKPRRGGHKAPCSPVRGCLD